MGTPELHGGCVPGRRSRSAPTEGFNHSHDSSKPGRKGIREPHRGRTDFRIPRVETPRNVAVAAAKQLIDRFCGGSVEELLVGMVDNRVLEPKQLKQLAEKIASRKEKRA